MTRKKIPEKTKKRVREAAKNRCGYCLSLQRLIPIIFQIDHILPVIEGGTDEEDNLWLLCGACNNAKSDKTSSFDEETKTFVPLFNPRTQDWNQHFEWSSDGLYIIGKTAVGRATVTELKLNAALQIIARQNWVTAGWHPPED
jgi:hypothetical protein